jgi:hypothetical protein
LISVLLVVCEVSGIAVGLALVTHAIIEGAPWPGVGLAGALGAVVVIAGGQLWMISPSSAAEGHMSS